MQVNDLEFNVQAAGEKDALIWAHGLMASIASEDALGIFEWGAFPQEKKLVRYDARGHGQTEPSFSPEDYHWRNLAGDMIAIADQLGIAEFVAGGQSMGCATTIYAGQLAPQRIKGLLLMNPPTAWETRAEQGELYKQMAQMGYQLGGAQLAQAMSGQLDRLLPGWLVEEKADGVSGILDGITPLTNDTLLNLLNGAALTDLPPREEIAEIDIPALILGWTGDQTHPIETAVELDNLLPHSTLVIAENYAELEQWPQLIREFVSEHIV